MKYAHVALGVAGLGATVAMLRHTDLGALRSFGAWAALAVVIEGLRVVAESLATRALHGGSVRVPWGQHLRAHAVGYALAMTMPSGRTVAEAAKAVMLAPWTGGGQNVGVAVTNQSLVMAGVGAVALPCALAAWSLGDRALAGAVALQGALLIAMGAGLLTVARSEPVARWVARRFPSVAQVAERARAGARVRGVPLALACFMAHRAVQSAQLFVLLGALGVWDVRRALALGGAVIIGTSVGAAVPGQLGAVGGALALAAPGVGVPASQALAMALVIHAAQFGWSALGFGVWTLTRAEKSEGQGAAASAP